MIEALKQRVNDDEALVRRGRYLTTTFLLEVGRTAWLIAHHMEAQAYKDGTLGARARVRLQNSE